MMRTERNGVVPAVLLVTTLLFLSSSCQAVDVPMKKYSLPHLYRHTSMSHAMMGMKNMGSKTSGKGKGYIRRKKPEPKEPVSRLAICVVDDRGFPISESDPAFDEGVVIEADITFDEAQSNLGEIFDAVADTASALGGILTLAVAGTALFAGGVALLAAAAVFFILGAVFSQGPSEELIEIRNQFRALNERLDTLTSTIENLFNQLRTDLADAVLDEVNNALVRMSSTYQDFGEALALEPSSLDEGNTAILRRGLEDNYRESFRIACNELNYRPQDIVGILYGHNCGDPSNFPDRCATYDGINTGGCGLFPRQRGYFLDKFRGGDSTLASLRDYQQWVLNTLLQSMYFQTVCLPPLQDTCQGPDDPIYKTNLNMTVQAIEEVVAVFSAAEECICPCKEVTLVSVDTTNVREDTNIGTVTGFIRVGIESSTPDISADYTLFEFRGSQPNAVTALVPTVYTPGDTIVLEVEETNPVVANQFTRFEQAFGVEKYYQNQCADYSVTETIAGDVGEATFELLVRGLSANECRRRRPDFCSTDLLECGANPEENFCDTANFSCTPKVADGETCDANRQCLSGFCDSTTSVCAEAPPPTASPTLSPDMM